MVESSSRRVEREEILEIPRDYDDNKGAELQKKIYKYYQRYSKYTKKKYSWPMKVFETRGQSNWVACCSYSPDGNYLAAGSKLKTVEIWNIKDQKEKFTLNGHSSWVLCSSYSPDGNYLATGSGDSTVKIWNIKKKREEFTLKGHSGSVSCCSYSPDGNYLLTGSEDKTVKIWNIKEQREEFTLKGHSGWVFCCSYSPDGNYLASGSGDNTVKIWNIKEQREEFTLNGYSAWVLCCSYSPDGNYLAAGSRDKSVKIWNIKEQREEFILNDLSDWIMCCSYSPDGNYLAFGSSDSMVKIWNIKKQREQFTLIENSGSVSCCSYSPDGNYLAAGSEKRTIKIWNIKEQREEFTLNRYSDSINCCSYSLDGNFLVTGSDDYKFHIWKLKKQKVDLNLNKNTNVSIDNKLENLTRTLKPQKYSITNIKKPTNDGLHTIKCNDNGSISFWNISESREDFILCNYSSKMIGLYFIENEKYLVAVYRSNIFMIAYWNKLLYILHENLFECIITRENIELLFKDAKVAIFIYKYYNEYYKSKVKIEEQLPLIVSKLLIKFDFQKRPDTALNISIYIVKFVYLNYRIKYLNDRANRILMKFYSKTQNKSLDIKGIYESQILRFLYHSILEFDTKQKIGILLDQLKKLIT